MTISRKKRNAAAQRKYRTQHPARVRAAKQAHYRRKKKSDPQYWSRLLRRFRKLHPERYHQYNLRARFALRLKVFSHYGRKCRCCGCDILEFLTINHVKGGGTKHRKRARLFGQNFYRWLVNHRFPKGFETLCMNCNLAEARYGGCPHQRRQQP
jgi:hypothetical protein